MARIVDEEGLHLDCATGGELHVALHAGIPGARLELIERAGHNPHAEQPAPVMRAIRDFIANGD